MFLLNSLILKKLKTYFWWVHLNFGGLLFVRLDIAVVTYTMQSTESFSLME
jgi:hypothetical protein